MFSVENLPAFLAAAFLLNAAPGPDHIYILSRTLAQGRLMGLVSSWGVCSGALVHVLAAALGFSVIIRSSPLAYALLKYVGAGYLFFLGLRAFRHNTFSVKTNGAEARPQSAKKIYLQGVMVDLLNPKVALFFLAFLPQFVPDGHPHRVELFLTLGGVVILIAVCIEAVLVLGADYILSGVVRRPGIAKYLNYAMGTVFMALAVNLAV